MTDPTAITPPPELVHQWFDVWQESDDDDVGFGDYVSVHAAQYGADQELEACCEMLQGWRYCRVEDLRAARRPKPPSMKEQALEDLELLIADLANHGMGFKATNIRRALEQLPDD